MEEASQPETSLGYQVAQPKKVISDNAGSILADPEPAAVLKPVQVARIRTAFAAKEPSGQLSKQQVRELIHELQLPVVREEGLFASFIVSQAAAAGDLEANGIKMSCEDFLEHYCKLVAPSTQFGERLRRACARGEEDIIRDLISRGTNPNFGDGLGSNSVHYATEFGQVGVLHLLKELCGDSLLLDSKDKSGWTPLTTAIIHNQPKAAEALIQMGAKLNEVNNEGRTALHWACSKGREGLVELLVGHGADLNIKDRTGWTPLHYASINQHASIIKTLIKNGADVSLSDNLNYPPQHYVGEDGWAQVSRELSESRKSSSAGTGSRGSKAASYPKEVLGSGYSTLGSTGMA